MGFRRKLREAIDRNNTLLCVGLDSEPSQMPPGISIVDFNRAIIESTCDLVCAYKPNLAFYEAEGIDGLCALEQTLRCIPSDIPVIGDAKRGDIGNTARKYAQALFDVLGFDAATVNPYLGYDSVEPFVSYPKKGVFLLCRTSNPSAKDFQDLQCDGMPLYERVARKALDWNVHGNLGLVVGATFPQELQRIRRLCPTMPLLVPGVGAQGGDLPTVTQCGVDESGGNAIINVSRAVLYASKGPDFAAAARATAETLRNTINAHRAPQHT